VPYVLISYAAPLTAAGAVNRAAMEITFIVEESEGGKEEEEVVLVDTATPNDRSQRQTNRLAFICYKGDLTGQ
tara:strand:- start:263 stop:481 length:219 start_codon:yes stop_codon:yes gene_type:complete